MILVIPSASGVEYIGFIGVPDARTHRGLFVSAAVCDVERSGVPIFTDGVTVSWLLQITA